MKKIGEASKRVWLKRSIITTRNQWNSLRNYRNTIIVKEHQQEEKENQRDERPKLITAALPYVNNIPHLGNIVQMLSADVYNRYCKQHGEKTLFICGTDEYGTATEVKAIQEKKTPREICDKYHELHDHIYKWFNLEFDYFGRTSTETQTEVAQDIFKKIHEQGYFNVRDHEQLYCNSCEISLADRLVKGTCPSCGDKGARGDQCDACGHVLNQAAELHDPTCSICQATPELKMTKHVFFKLPQLYDELKQQLKTRQKTWPEEASRIATAFTKTADHDRCISRDLTWGTPIPLEGHEKQVMYVWFDAPIGYLSMTKDYLKNNKEDNYESWWKNDDNVRLIQFMGKDNVPFHSVLFPSTLIATRDQYTLVDTIAMNGYLTYEHEKFSKSRNIGVFGSDAIQTGIESDIWRYYLMRIRPEGDDANFRWDDFGEFVNSELIAKYGNYMNRVLKFSSIKLGATLSDHYPEMLTLDDTRFIRKVTTTIRLYHKNMEAIQLRDALVNIIKVAQLGNQHLQLVKPWTLLHTKNKKYCATLLHVHLHVVIQMIRMIRPFMPEHASAVAASFDIPDISVGPVDEEVPLDILYPGLDFNMDAIKPPFRSLNPQETQKFHQQFSGIQQEQL